MLACGNYCGDSDVLLGMTLGIELDTLMVVASRGLVMVAMKMMVRIFGMGRVRWFLSSYIFDLVSLCGNLLE